MGTPEGDRTLGAIAQHTLRVIALIDIPLLMCVFIASYALARISLRPLEQMRAREQRFLADAAHELRTPLAIIASTAQAAAPTDAGSRAAFESITGTALRASGVISDLLLLVRQPELDTRSQEPLDLGFFVDRIAKEYGAHASFVIHSTYSPGVYILGDADRLQRLIVNVLENAVRHARSVVDVSVQVIDGNAEILFVDDGNGVAPADHERIFERFFTRGCVGESSGLGLPICRWIARAHHGDITVNGACFRVWIPLTSA